MRRYTTVDRGRQQAREEARRTGQQAARPKEVCKHQPSPMASDLCQVCGSTIEENK